MIDPQQVEQLARMAHARANQRKAGGAHLRPVRHRQTPSLTGRGERVWRRTDCTRQIEHVLVGPDLGAFAARGKREIAPQQHAAPREFAAQLAPLPMRDELDVRIER